MPKAITPQFEKSVVSRSGNTPGRKEVSTRRPMQSRLGQRKGIIVRVKPKAKGK